MTPTEVIISDYQVATGNYGVSYDLVDVENSNVIGTFFLRRLMVRERKELQEGKADNMSLQLELLTKFLNKKFRRLENEPLELETLKKNLSVTDYNIVWAWLRDGIPEKASSEKLEGVLKITCAASDLTNGVVSNFYDIIDAETGDKKSIRLAPLTLEEIYFLNEKPLMQTDDQLEFVASLLSKPQRKLNPTDPDVSADWLGDNLSDHELTTVFNWLFAGKAEVDLDPKILAQAQQMIASLGQN
jgi:hypothetical protein